MQAIIIVGHGSLRSRSGAAMIRLATRVREAGVAPIVAAGFLNYSRPRFGETLAHCVARGATEVVVQPYFLISGKFVHEDIPPLVATAHTAYPRIDFGLAQPFGDHPALAQLVMQRAATLAPQAHGNGGLLMMAHGSPDPTANQPIYTIAEQIRAMGHYRAVTVCFLELNSPSISEAVDGLVAQGIRKIAAVPYFLQLGGHVAEDLPKAIAVAQMQHPATEIVLTEHLAYDPLLATVIADRIAEVCAASATDEADASTSHQQVPSFGTTTH